MFDSQPREIVNPSLLTVNLELPKRVRVFSARARLERNGVMLECSDCISNRFYPRRGRILEGQQFLSGSPPSRDYRGKRGAASR